MKTLVDIALEQLGVKETAPNSGPKINEYLASCGLPPGHPWCAAMVCWCIIELKKLGIPTNFRFSAGVMDMWAKNKLLYAIPKPKPGCIFIMKFGGGKGHTGVVKAVEGNWVLTVEGNTDADGGREGVEVAEKRRLITSIYGWLDPYKPQK
jgi:hypothetical protein